MAAEAVNHGAIAVRSTPCLPGHPLIVRRSVAQTNALTGWSRSRSSGVTISVTSAVTRQRVAQQPADRRVVVDVHDCSPSRYGATVGS